MPAKVILNGSHEASLADGNLSELELDFSFDNFSPNIEFLEDWQAEFVTSFKNNKNTVKFINDFIDAFGIHNGIPAEIKDTTTGQLLLDGYIDLADGNNQYDDDRCNYKLLVKNRKESFFELAENLNLLELLSSNYPSDVRISRSDYGQTRTILANIPDNGQAFLLLVTIFLISYQIYLQGRDLIKAIFKSSTSATFTVAAGGAVAWSTFDIIEASLLLTFLIISLRGLLIQMSDLLFQKPRAYNNIKIKTLLEKGCKALGYTLDTSLYDGDYSNKSVISKVSVQGSRNLQPVNTPIPQKTLLELFEQEGKFFNAKIKLQGRTVLFENKQTYLDNPTNYVLSNLKFNGVYSYNLGSLPRSIEIAFNQDPINPNTLLDLELLDIEIRTNDPNTRGDKLTATFSLNNVVNPDIQSLKGELKVDLGVIRAYRKDKESRLEKLFNGIWDASQVILGRKDRLESRVGFMLLNLDTITQDTVFIADGDRISKENFRLIHAQTIYENFYQNERPQENQWKTYTERDPEPICDLSVVAELAENNVIKGRNGQTIAVQINKRNAENNEHEITYLEKVQTNDKGYVAPEIFNETITVI